MARQAADYGVQAGPVTVDMTKVRERKRDIVDSFRGGSQRRIERTEGLDLIMGQARFVGAKTIEVQLNGGGLRMLSADTIVINTGTRTRVPSFFARADGIELAWSIIDPVLAGWARAGAPAPALYEPGSWGSAEADSMLAAEGRAWCIGCGGHVQVEGRSRP